MLYSSSDDIMSIRDQELYQSALTFPVTADTENRPPIFGAPVSLSHQAAFMRNYLIVVEI